MSLQPPDLEAVARAVIHAQSRGSRTSAPSGSAAFRAHMVASPACAVVTHDELGSQKCGQHMSNNLSSTCQNTNHLDTHRSGLCLSMQKLGVRRNYSPHYNEAELGASIVDGQRGNKFTALQMLILLCFLISVHYKLGMQVPPKWAYRYKWVITRIHKSIYRRRKLTQKEHTREILSWNEVPTDNCNTMSRTGPKSSSRRRTVRTHMLFLMLLCLVNATGATRVTTEARTSAATGADGRTTSRMPTNSENTGEARSMQANGLKWIAKRALRRARARAEKAGGTNYRGRWYTADQLHNTRRGIVSPSGKPDKKVVSSAQPRRHQTGTRIKCVTFNISGASSSAWQECMAWLQDNQQHVDVALVQETHWKGEGSRDFMSGPWFVVTTGATSSDSKAGLAVLIHKRLGGPEQISAQTRLQGRLMHVRIHQGANSVDIINLYQSVWRSQLDREGNTKCREGDLEEASTGNIKNSSKKHLYSGG